jgi:hypothetical protein
VTLPSPIRERLEDEHGQRDIAQHGRPNETKAEAASRVGKRPIPNPERPVGSPHQNVRPGMTPTTANRRKSDVTGKCSKEAPFSMSWNRFDMIPEITNPITRATISVRPASINMGNPGMDLAHHNAAPMPTAETRGHPCRFATTRAPLAYCGAPHGTARSESDCCRSVTTPVRECNAECDSKNPETTRDE